MKRFENLSLKMSYLLPASEGWGKVTFSVCSHIWGEVPHPGLGWGGTLAWSRWWGGVIPSQGWGVPSQVWMVGGTLTRSRWLEGTPVRSGWWGECTPLARSGWWGYRPPTRQSSIVSTCYAAGSMPLAFMQEDFLVRK